MEGPLIPGGCILLARKIIESRIWEKPPLYLKVWVYLLTQAQHSDYKRLHRGQLRTSIPEIIEACKWKIGARTERPTKDQVYQIINWLRNPDEGGYESNTRATAITTTKATQGMIITIDNYAHYQTFENYESNGESNDEKATKPPRKQRRPNNINKNDKNDKNDKNEEQKKIYAENVSLLDSEYQNLVEKYGQEMTTDAIEFFSLYKKEKGYQSKSDYAAMVRWVVNAVTEKKVKEERAKQQQRGNVANFPQKQTKPKLPIASSTTSEATEEDIKRILEMGKRLSEPKAQVGG